MLKAGVSSLITIAPLTSRQVSELTGIGSETAKPCFNCRIVTETRFRDYARRHAPVDQIARINSNI